MSGSKSDYLENKDLDHNLGKTSFTMPATVYAALCTVTPTDASTGSTLTEATYTGYARVQVLASALNAASGGSSTNGSDIVFGNCTGGSSAIVGVALCDASTAGNVLYWMSTTSKTIDTADTPATIKAGSLTITED